MFSDDQKGPVLVLAPHPDDETLGAGGALLRAAAQGRAIHWLIGTKMRAEDGWPAEKMALRDKEIETVTEAFGFTSVHILPFPAARLDTLPMGDLVAAIGAVVKEVEPETILLPHRGDAHSDHAALHEAGAACAKWFRYPSVRNTLVYEVLSETDAAVQDGEKFEPNVFVDIADFLERKLEITSMFGAEIQPFPFPRSLRAVRAQAEVRGVACGAAAAECFMLLRSNQ
ncbi:PIG-L family deacetylase [Thalassobius sp. I31.1]|uniref:PIG-L deacetylase family protein n=1 Tax=Thalassobius sp. I31.1 TaxID=2109912 RepID=UPI000D1C00B4|nr:PIG-L family deacetylase [Thalassobius sp. I31.1]